MTLLMGILKTLKYSVNFIYKNMKRPNRKEYVNKATKVQLIADQGRYIDYLEDKNIELLNWIKSELQEETHDKLGKTMGGYRSYKILLLTKIINKIKG